MPHIFPRSRRYTLKQSPLPDDQKVISKDQGGKEMKSGTKLISSLFKIVHYGRGEPITQRTHDLEEEFREFVDQHEGRSPERNRSRSRSMGRSAPSNKKPPVIRIRRDQSLNGNMWGSPQQPASTTSDSTVSPMMDPPSSSIQHGDIILPSAAATQAQQQHQQQQQQQQQQEHQAPRKARKRSMKRKPPTTGSSELINVTNPPSSLVRSLSRSDLLVREEGQARSHLQVAADGRRSRSHEALLDRRGSHESLATTTTTSTTNANGGRHHHHVTTHHHHHHHPQLPDYAEEAKKFVRTAIEASNKPVDKQIIRIINGYSPSIQSQVLLNTKTTQPWDELVRDLGMAVKLPKSRATSMETISGRKIQSYSQLRTELLAGNLAFYIYPERDMSNEFGLPPLSRNVNMRMPERSLGKAESKGKNGNGNKNDKKLPPLMNQNQNGSSGSSSKNLNNMEQRYQVGGLHKSYEALHDTETKYRRSKHQQHERQNRYGSVTQLDVNDNGGMEGGHRANSRSNPALRSRSPYPEQTSTGVQTTLDVPQKKRETRRRRSEASVYLASASRSRSRSISPN